MKILTKKGWTQYKQGMSLTGRVIHKITIEEQEDITKLIGDDRLLSRFHGSNGNQSARIVGFNDEKASLKHSYSIQEKLSLINALGRNELDSPDLALAKDKKLFALIESI